MKTDRSAILQLVALGRITPAEAERLLLAWNEGREALWALAACMIAFILAQVHLDKLLPGLAHVARLLFGPGSHLTHHALAVVTQLLGGVR